MRKRGAVRMRARQRARLRATLPRGGALFFFPLSPSPICLRDERKRCARLLRAPY